MSGNVDLTPPEDVAGEEMVANVKLHVRQVLQEPLKFMHAQAREVLVSQVASVAVQACFAFLKAHEDYVKPNREAEELPEVERQYRDEERAVVRRAMAQGRAADDKDPRAGSSQRGEGHFGEPRTMYDWVGPRPDWYTGPLRSEGDPPPEDLPK